MVQKDFSQGKYSILLLCQQMQHDNLRTTVLDAQRLSSPEATRHRDSWPLNLFAAFSRCTKSSQDLHWLSSLQVYSVFAQTHFHGKSCKHVICRLHAWRPPVRWISHSCHFNPASQNLLLKPGCPQSCVPSPSISAGDSSSNWDGSAGNALGTEWTNQCHRSSSDPAIWSKACRELGDRAG